jgi:hypothetical protein
MAKLSVGNALLLVVLVSVALSLEANESFL